MPIYEYECLECGQVFESIEVWKSHKATECKFCGSTNIYRLIGTPHVTMNVDAIKHSLPDPTPPLTEAKPMAGSETGLKDLPRTELKNYVRTHDKQGNTIWKEKRRQYVDMGRKK
jgi:putative FmdB family regulatory protein